MNSLASVVISRVVRCELARAIAKAPHTTRLSFRRIFRRLLQQLQLKCSLYRAVLIASFASSVRSPGIARLALVPCDVVKECMKLAENSCGAEFMSCR